MKFNYLKLPFFLLFIVCTSTISAQRLPIKIGKYKHKKVYLPNPQDRTKSYTFNFSIEYFKKAPENSIFEHINQEIIHYLSLPEANNKNLKEVVNGLIEAEIEDYNTLYDNISKNTPNHTLQHTLDMELTYEGKVKGVYTFINYFSTYAGGAHPMDSFLTLNYDGRSGELLTLNDIFKPGYDYKLSNLILNKLDKDVLFNKFTIDLPTQFIFKEAGVEFIYNRYEVAPYSAGPQYALVTYENLKELLKEEYLNRK